jgi:hypothetical protein
MVNFAANQIQLLIDYFSILGIFWVRIGFSEAHGFFDFDTI